MTVVKAQNSDTAIRIANGTGGTAARSSIFLDVDSGGAQLMAIDDGFSTSGAYIADGVTFVSDTAMANGMTIGTRANDNNAHLRFYTKDAERMRISGAGNVGIGTTSPNHKLTISGGTNTGLQILGNNTGTTNNDGFKIYVRNDNNGAEIVQLENSFLSFHTNSAEKMRIDLSLIHI